MNRKVEFAQSASRFAAADVFVTIEEPRGMSAVISLKPVQEKDLGVYNRSKLLFAGLGSDGFIQIKLLQFLCMFSVVLSFLRVGCHAPDDKIR
jgi:hypothetical protein